METEKIELVEETLDPENWYEMQLIGHRMVDDMLEYLRTVRDRPVWHPLEEETKNSMKQPLPRKPEPTARVYEEFLEHILSNPMGNIHPRFWGWVIGTGTPTGMLAEMLAAGMNPNLGGGDQVAVYVEQQVLDWCKEMMGFPMSASGLLVSGGSMANLTGLAAARSTKAGFDIRKEGLANGRPPMVMYASNEAHSSVQKAVELMGLGSQNLRQIPVNDHFQIDLQALEETYQADLKAGLHPFCVVGNAGTVNTGGIDDLEALADFCQRNNLWFHVDGAFGALAALSPDLRPLLKGMERADSLAFDLHKWMGLPIEIGCVLVRSKDDHHNAFALTPGYLAHTNGGIGGGENWFSEYGVELTRGFRALKAWMVMKEQGVDKIGRVIRQNVQQARYLGELVIKSPKLELLAPVTLNIVCFRYQVPGMETEQLNQFNQGLLVRLHESGVAAPSYAVINGQYALRVANVNHRSRREDFNILVREVIRLGDEKLREMDLAR